MYNCKFLFFALGFKIISPFFSCFYFKSLQKCSIFVTRKFFKFSNILCNLQGRRLYFLRDGQRSAAVPGRHRGGGAGADSSLAGSAAGGGDAVRHAHLPRGAQARVAPTTARPPTRRCRLRPPAQVPYSKFTLAIFFSFNFIFSF